ncbi:MAG: class I SAM-dependent methyltransferase [Anaerolineaceae bacterium]|nr:class I SAM-dependent methyltransferase [Anaerolineaceae bacterium]
MKSGYNDSMRNTEMKPVVNLLTSPDWEDYQLLDSGDGRKLEQFGPYRLIRPEAEAVWSPMMGESEWQKASAEFVPTAEEMGGHWKTLKKLPEFWKVCYRDLTFKAMLANSKQVGIFPEQACQWDWAAERIRSAGRQLKVLNLFGYTGGSTMACAAAGAKVTHLDASKKAVAWAKDNQEFSKIPTDRIRWIMDDALKFVQREARRGSFYDGVILDPPKFGRGPKGEVWEFYKGFPTLLQACADVLSEQADFMLVTAYAVKASSVTLYNALAEVNRKRKGSVSVGEVCNCDRGGRLLSMAVYGRWMADRESDAR